MSLLTASCMLLMVDKTLIMQKIPNVIPRRDRNVRSLFERNSCKAILKLVHMISQYLNIIRIYTFRDISQRQKPLILHLKNTHYNYTLKKDRSCPILRIKI